MLIIIGRSGGQEVDDVADKRQYILAGIVAVVMLGIGYWISIGRGNDVSDLRDGADAIRGQQSEAIRAIDAAGTELEHVETGISNLADINQGIADTTGSLEQSSDRITAGLTDSAAIAAELQAINRESAGILSSIRARGPIGATTP